MLAAACIGAVVITAMAYRQEVERTLRDDLGFRGVIATLGQRLDVSEG